ncbi:4-hydroxybenzoate polyprenyltransferase-like prenyltransferase [Thermoplasmatales archaeon SCGC AB-540-F20]|nr:4-hydroxybenzoate polyprenyltransferase-like prenyltransferase [Thermoplasmatales archaeon SCGC AB-540-F20]
MGICYWISVVGIYVFNDLVGIEEDAAINPKRPLPSGRVTKKGSLIFSLILLTIGVVLWWFTFKNSLEFPHPINMYRSYRNLLCYV